MITMARIQGPSMGFANFQKPILQTPGLRGIFDFDMPPMPKFPPFEFPLDAGSGLPGDGGADGGAPPAPVPPPGGEAAVPLPGEYPGYYPQQQPTYLFQVQDVPTAPAAAVPAAAAAPTPGIPTWAIIGGSVLAGVAITALLFK